MAFYLGIDTSNYTTSAAVYDDVTHTVIQSKRLLPVSQGKLGLKQSDAVFLHVKQLGQLVEEVLLQMPGTVTAVGASVAPRDEVGSYMPCFLVGKLAAQTIASGSKLPFYHFSHQNGHIAAALYSVNRLDLMQQTFLAFHFSGGTTQCLLVQPDMEISLRITTVAETLDLNAGQAVDRVGGMLNLAFPAGPALEALAMESEQVYQPKPTLKGPNCCLSGLENLCAGRLEQGGRPQDVARFCLDYLAQLVLKMTAEVLTAHPGLPLVYAGGVMSNSIIRSQVEQAYPQAMFAEPQFSCDNAAGTAVLCAVRHREMQTC